MKRDGLKSGRKYGVWLLVALAWTVLAIPAGAQKKNNKKNNDSSNPDADASIMSMIPKTDTQAIDNAISEMMGYWQIGDVASMSKYFSPDVVVVSGAYEPPVVGWDNYVRAYEAQRARVSGGRMDRFNTLVKVNGNTAWATYQFVYDAVMDNKMTTYRGHTTLILNKQANRWVITLDHSSVVDSGTPATASSANSAPTNP